MKNQDGFTLIEIIAVMIILSLLASIMVPRYINLEQNAKQKQIDASISELNGRESLVWANLKISATGYNDDAQLFLVVDYNLGTDHVWKPSHPTVTGGNLTLKGKTVTLNRKQSTVSQPAVWSRSPL
jgi:prepilin-type N-terminal cleavage/methylation domain-containing protein